MPGLWPFAYVADALNRRVREGIRKATHRVGRVLCLLPRAPAPRNAPAFGLDAEIGRLLEEVMD